MEDRCALVRPYFSALDGIKARSVELRNARVKCTDRKDCRGLVNSVISVNNARTVTGHSLDAKQWSSTYYLV